MVIKNLWRRITAIISTIVGAVAALAILLTNIDTIEKWVDQRMGMTPEATGKPSQIGSDEDGPKNEQQNDVLKFAKISIDEVNGSFLQKKFAPEYLQNSLGMGFEMETLILRESAGVIRNCFGTLQRKNDTSPRFVSVQKDIDDSLLNDDPEKYRQTINIPEGTASERIQFYFHFASISLPVLKDFSYDFRVACDGTVSNRVNIPSNVAGHLLPYEKRIVHSNHWSNQKDNQLYIPIDPDGPYP
ncbi:hypothetical protein BMW22_02070 [Rhizobium leguminosarum]|uniref:Uncharacterized protein n=1 Tax=Rhizobium leguminosarum TaxID=384 RepID=A0A1L3Z4J1_RHILE|nr:hypothetical protein [Rhizobium leguminosarum]API50579.1 hypothetical protein BMW22_02070 [Rhizobium leguminosarum]